MSLDLSNVFNETTINVKIINSTSHKLLCYDVYLNIIKKIYKFYKDIFCSCHFIEQNENNFKIQIIFDEYVDYIFINSLVDYLNHKYFINKDNRLTFELF